MMEPARVRSEGEWYSANWDRRKCSTVPLCTTSHSVLTKASAGLKRAGKSAAGVYARFGKVDCARKLSFANRELRIRLLEGEELHPEELLTCLLGELDLMNGPLIPKRLYELFYQALHLRDDESRVGVIRLILRRLPKERLSALREIVVGVSHTITDRQSLEDAAKCIGPRLAMPMSSSPTWREDAPYIELLCKIMLQRWAAILPKTAWQCLTNSGGESVGQSGRNQYTVALPRTQSITSFPARETECAPVEMFPANGFASDWDEKPDAREEEGSSDTMQFLEQSNKRTKELDAREVFLHSKIRRAVSEWRSMLPAKRRRLSLALNQAVGRGVLISALKKWKDVSHSRNPLSLGCPYLAKIVMHIWRSASRRKGNGLPLHVRRNLLFTPFSLWRAARLRQIGSSESSNDVSDPSRQFEHHPAGVGRSAVLRNKAKSQSPDIGAPSARNHPHQGERGPFLQTLARNAARRHDGKMIEKSSSACSGGQKRKTSFGKVSTDDSYSSLHKRTSSSYGDRRSSGGTRRSSGGTIYQRRSLHRQLLRPSLAKDDSPGHEWVPHEDDARTDSLGEGNSPEVAHAKLPHIPRPEDPSNSEMNAYTSAVDALKEAYSSAKKAQRVFVVDDEDDQTNDMEQQNVHASSEREQKLSEILDEQEDPCAHVERKEPGETIPSHHASSPKKVEACVGSETIDVESRKEVVEEGINVDLGKKSCCEEETQTGDELAPRGFFDAGADVSIPDDFYFDEDRMQYFQSQPVDVSSQSADLDSLEANGSMNLSSDHHDYRESLSVDAHGDSDEGYGKRIPQDSPSCCEWDEEEDAILEQSLTAQRDSHRSPPVTLRNAPHVDGNEHTMPNSGTLGPSRTQATEDGGSSFVGAHQPHDIVSMKRNVEESVGVTSVKDDSTVRQTVPDAPEFFLHDTRTESASVHQGGEQLEKETEPGTPTAKEAAEHPRATVEEVSIFGHAPEMHEECIGTASERLEREMEQRETGGEPGGNGQQGACAVDTKEVNKQSLSESRTMLEESLEVSGAGKSAFSTREKKVGELDEKENDDGSGMQKDWDKGVEGTQASGPLKAKQGAESSPGHVVEESDFICLPGISLKGEPRWSEQSPGSERSSDESGENGSQRPSTDPHSSLLIDPPGPCVSWQSCSDAGRDDDESKSWRKAGPSLNILPGVKITTGGIAHYREASSAEVCSFCLLSGFISVLS